MILFDMNTLMKKIQKKTKQNASIYCSTKLRIISLKITQRNDTDRSGPQMTCAPCMRYVPKQYVPTLKNNREIMTAVSGDDAIEEIFHGRVICARR